MFTRDQCSLISLGEVEKKFFSSRMLVGGFPSWEGFSFKSIKKVAESEFCSDLATDQKCFRTDILGFPNTKFSIPQLVGHIANRNTMRQFLSNV